MAKNGYQRKSLTYDYWERAFLFGFEHSNLKGRCRHQLKKAIRSRSAGKERPTKIERASGVRPESSSTDRHEDSSAGSARGCKVRGSGTHHRTGRLSRIRFNAKTRGGKPGRCEPGETRNSIAGADEEARKRGNPGNRQAGAAEDQRPGGDPGPDRRER